MASLRRHKRSPFLYLRKRDLDTGKWIEQSTGLRADRLADRRKAERMADRASALENDVRALGNTAFTAWVPQYLATHYRSDTEGTGRRMRIAWQVLKAFLASHQIVYPRQIRYDHAEAYVVWRKANHFYGRAVGHNTTLLELKFLSQLLNEARRREHLESNPFAQLGVVKHGLFAREPVKLKPELSDDQIRTLLRKSRNEPEWIGRCIRIALYTGCRFSECEIESSHIDLQNGSLTLIDAKREEIDPRKSFTVPIADELRPVFEQMQRRNERVTCRLTQEKNARANYFFRKCGIDASFHSLRVTFITRCHRAGLSMAEAMRLVNHSSQLVHRIYSRLNVEDVRKARARLQLPSA